MILGQDGKPMAGESEPVARQVEIVRSFSFKLNLKNPDGSPAYEDCQFFCSKKDHCGAEDADELSRSLADFCVEQVQEDIRLFQERRAKRRASRARSAA